MKKHILWLIQFDSGSQVVFKVFQGSYHFGQENRRNSYRSDLPCTIFFKHKACLYPYHNLHLKVISGFHLNQNVEFTLFFCTHIPPDLNLWCVSLGEPKQLFHFSLAGLNWLGRSDCLCLWWRSELLLGLHPWFLEALCYCRNFQAQCTDETADFHHL